jgi:hypothetical protein
VGTNELEIEGWDDLCEVAAKARMSFDPDPAGDMCQRHWRFMSFEERHGAIQGILARLKCGQYSDPQYVHTLENYIRGRKWKESLRPRAGPVDKKAEAMDEAVKRMAKEANFGRKILAG